MHSAAVVDPLDEEGHGDLGAGGGGDGQERSRILELMNFRNVSMLSAVV